MLAMEALREKEAKERREYRSVRFEQVHCYMRDIVAHHLNIEETTVEEFVLDSEKQMDIIGNFLEVGGRRAVMFYYQDGEVAPSQDTGRVIPGHAKGSIMKQVRVTDGRDFPLTGLCMYFLRPTTNVQITMQNVAQSIFFGEVDCTSSTLSGSLENTLADFYKPCLQRFAGWGELTKTPQGMKTRRQFFESCNTFVHNLHSAELSSENTVHLEKSTLDIESIRNVQDCIDAASNHETLSSMESLVLTWCKQLEQVLTESEQIRKEADDTGPLAELEHWRQLSARFNSLFEQIKSHDCKMVLTTLRVAKSKVLKIWRDNDIRITQAACEAKDNTKYLYTLQKYCEPIYGGDLVSKNNYNIKLIPYKALMNIIHNYLAV